MVRVMDNMDNADSSSSPNLFELIIKEKLGVELTKEETKIYSKMDDDEKNLIIEVIKDDLESSDIINKLNRIKRKYKLDDKIDIYYLKELFDNKDEKNKEKSLKIPENMI